MSVHGLEQVLYDLGVTGEARKRFEADRPAFLGRYALSDEEAGWVSDFDVRAMYDAGVNPMLLQGYWLMLEPSHSIGRFMRAMRGES